MKKNIRKQGVEDIYELEEILRNENPEYYEILKGIEKSVNNPYTIIIFWNALASTETISSKQNAGETLTALSIGTALGILVSYLGGGDPQSLGAATLVGGIAGLDMSLLGAALNGPTNMSEKERYQLKIEGMLVMHPELYDLELAFNQADLEAVRNSVKETGYDGKQIYVEANKRWKKYLEDHKFTRPEKLDKEAHEFLEEELEPEK